MAHAYLVCVRRARHTHIPWPTPTMAHTYHTFESLALRSFTSPDPYPYP